ncbi:hypothetical protein DM02DRAFT_726793 [Periconia macrospinosa]|uniref:Uncharacterized protein n=1 Tax=Periconia macrospinosa TaxID=97972 RepID=A0A2V1DXC6_9PLEO|nr:hypothetical protein DM02DRAFT_726793 [Periconia macrospinosa]
MRIFGPAIILGATLELAFAEVICDPQSLHYRRKIVPEAERVDIFNTITQLCASTERSSLDSTSGTTFFAIVGKEDTLGRDGCEAQFKSIVEECIFSKNTGGGNVSNEGFQFKVSTDTSKLAANSPRALGSSNKNTKPQKPETKPNKPATKPNTPAADPSPKPGKASPAPGKASPAPGKASPAPGKASPKPSTESPTPGKAASTSPCDPSKKKQKPASKTKTGAIRRFISKLFGRASNSGPSETQPNTSPACASEDPPKRPAVIQKMGPEWGADTYYGRQGWPATKQTITDQELYWSARDAYDAIKKKGPTSPILVAALFVPAKGVWFGTIPRGDRAAATMKEKLEQRAPVLNSYIGEKTIINTEKSQTLYHAEDMAMYYALANGAGTGPEGKFPIGSRILNYGIIERRGYPWQLHPCDHDTAEANKQDPKFPGNTRPDCASTIDKMQITIVPEVPTALRRYLAELDSVEDAAINSHEFKAV